MGFGTMTRAVGGRFASLTARQTAALVGVSGLLAAQLVLIVAGGTGEPAVLGQLLLGLTVALVFLAVLQTRRRHGQEMGQLRQELRATRRQLTDLDTRLHVMQRQVVAAVEDERLAAHDRHRELRALLGQSPVAGSAGGPSIGIPASIGSSVGPSGTISTSASGTGNGSTAP